MRSVLRGTSLALVGTVLFSREVWAHPGHITVGGVMDTVFHVLSSPYHISVLAGVGVLAVAWALAARPGRAVPMSHQGEEDA